MPELFIIAGPNGAGKTTAAYSLLPEVFQTVEFVNADEIARGLSPLNPEGVAFEAGRIMLSRINELVRKEESFAFETTLSGLSYLKFLKTAKEKGYMVTLFFVHLENVPLAIERIAIRVSKGGHHIPSDVVARRYDKGMRNFSAYSNLADSWYILDNSGKEYKWVAKFAGNEVICFDDNIYKRILAYGSEKKS